MKHAILIIAHKNFEYLLDLVKYFDNKSFFLYIHIDKKSSFTKKQINILYNQPNVYSIIRKYSINWGGFKILKASLSLFKMAISDGLADYYHLVSGMDFPIKNVDYFLNFFEKNNGYEFISYHTLPNRVWEDGTLKRLEYYWINDFINTKTSYGDSLCSRFINWQIKHNLKRKDPHPFNTLYGGSGWFSLSKECVKYILSYTTQTSAFYNRMKYTFAPEETYFPTIILNSEFAKITINDNLRYIDWRERNGNFPANLDESDYSSLIHSHALFARKFEDPISKNLLLLIKASLKETKI